MNPQNGAYEAFASRAREYCDFIERADQYDPWGFVTRLQTVLPRLYAAAIELPYPDPWPDQKEKLDLGPGPSECAAILNRLAEVLPIAEYWTTLEPLKLTDEEVDVGCAILADDLADIYHDVIPGIRMIDRDFPRERSQFQWKHQFMSHWGEKLVEALRILHLVSFDLCEWRDRGATEDES